MASMKLFGNRISPACKYCSEAMGSVASDNKILCIKHGIVPPEHSCRRFSYEPTKRVPHRPPSLDTYSKQDFEL